MRALNKIIYVQSPGHFIGVEKNRIYVSGTDKKRAYFNYFDIDAIAVGNSSSVSASAMEFCAEKGITLVVYDWSGKFRCRIEGDKNKNVFIRRAQVLLGNSAESSLALAKRVVDKKIKSMHSIFPFEEYKKLREKAGKAVDYSTLLGVEGIVTKEYFSKLRKEFQNLGFAFPKRSFYPPEDEANSLLSLSYSMLKTEIYVLLNIFGLDPAFGFLHRDYYGRDSLVCDIIEPFRSLIADQFVLYAIESLELVSNKHFKKTNRGIMFDDDEKRRAFYKLFRTKFFSDKLRVLIMDFIREIYDHIVDESRGLGLLITKQDSDKDVA